jgi:uncharacterized protein with GYD domain
MATYVVLASFTDQGIRNIRESPKRAQAFKDMAKSCGVTIKDIYWTLGHHDIVTTIEAPDDMTMAALGMSLGALGNVRTQTMRAFSETEIKGILDKMV